MEKKYIQYLLFSLMIVIISIGAINFIVDPLLYYQRSNRAIPALYTEDLRRLTPGLIKNSPDHNAIIIGSSMSGNFIASEVSKKLHTKTIKLAIDGATLYEQNYILSKYFDYHPDAKIVIWGIDLSYVSDPDTITTQKNYDYPFFLYSDTTLNFKYLLDYDVTIHSFQTLANYLFGIGFYLKKSDLDVIHTWDTPTGCRQVMDHYRLVSSELLDEFITKDFDQQNAERNLNRLLKTVTSNETVQFYIFLPPYSIVRYYISYENNALDRLLLARDFIAEKTKGINNLKIVDLQSTAGIIDNLNYYKDMGHYNRAINNIIIKNIIDGNFTGYEDILKNTQRLRSLIVDFDFENVKKCRPST